jgi:hypothetical protein
MRNVRAGPYDSTIMKLRRVTGSLLVASGLASGVFAAPAQAEPGDNAGNVDDFLGILQVASRTTTHKTTRRNSIAIKHTMPLQQNVMCFLNSLLVSKWT